jgi:hypothetical protein
MTARLRGIGIDVQKNAGSYQYSVFPHWFVLRIRGKGVSVKSKFQHEKNTIVLDAALVVAAILD